MCNDSEAAKAASPGTSITADDPPFLFAHGTSDPLVPFTQSTELHTALKQFGVSSTLLTMQDGGHGFAAKELDDTVASFSAQHLRGEEGAAITDKTIPVKKR